ncbi:hypothetical protein [Idiomarina ramblicola]|uniref:Uncharacterized protein n=1 Tax=Idiomarina ramblicola TaxID=263724 RepID=A0A432YZV6_9GAMM|nr:hypothetical protein [Idiomarina ramblicola]RUO69449.1 hypothetical protein CWI78_05900 [Idiomarina ramblicola]
MKVNEKRKIFGLTMTRRAWNNVLVYAILIIMVVFWYVAPPVKEETESGIAEEPVSGNVIGLIPDDGNLKSIQIDQLTLALKDQQWRCQAPCRLSEKAVQSVAGNWLALTMEPTNQAAENLITEVYFRFAGGEEARVELYAEPELMIRLPNQQQNYKVKEFTASQLLGH